jgi:hypothetical protein
MGDLEVGGRVPSVRARCGVLVALVLAACVGGRVAERGERAAWRERQGLQHEWWSERGLVIPHATFPADCRLCHVEGEWSTLRADFEFDHAQETGVALEGAHAAAQCLRCHNDRGPALAFAQRGCVGCHDDVHEGVRGTSCAQCHGQSDWRVDEDRLVHSRSRFALVGPHASAACRDCHVGIEGGVLEQLSTSCESCHTDDLSRAQDPDHYALGWTTGCEECHQVSTFDSAGFLHPGFRLDGGHAALSCKECHAGGNYAGTPSACVACHQDDYNGAMNPNHAAAGFPTSCQNCHSTSSWSGATFDHVWFPIVGGDHGGLSCTTCHQAPGNFSSFSCIHCHAHRQSEMDDEHEDVPGYAWQSNACYQCHPQGEEHAARSARRPASPRRTSTIRPVPGPRLVRPPVR